MGIYIRPDGTSAEVQPGLGVVAPRNLTARPMARPTGNQIAPQLAAQRARAAAEAQRQAEEEQARRRMYDECRRRGDYICEEAELGAAAGLGSGLSSDASQNLNCGHNEYVACDDSGYVTTCNCYPMSQAEIAHRDAEARRQEQRRQQQQQQQQARQRQQQANIAALTRVRPRPATAALPR